MRQKLRSLLKDRNVLWELQFRHSRQGAKTRWNMPPQLSAWAAREGEREGERGRGTRAEVEAAQVSNEGKRLATKKTCFGSLLCWFPPSTVESVRRRDEEKRSRSFPSARCPLPPPPAALWFLLIVTWRPLSIIPAVWRQLIRSSRPFGCCGCGVMEMKTRLGAMLLLIWTLQGKLINPPHVHRGACSRDW